MQAANTDALAKIAGNVVASSDPGRALKAWREKLGIKQVLLAKEMRISPSVLSDYESGRRPSPGVLFVRRYIEALVGLDESKGRVVSKLVSNDREAAILAIGEFQTPVKASQILRAVDGRLLTGDESFVNLYGYTVVDSIKTIYALSGYDFYRIFGATTERAGPARARAGQEGGNHTGALGFSERGGDNLLAKGNLAGNLFTSSPIRCHSG